MSCSLILNLVELCIASSTVQYYNSMMNMPGTSVVLNQEGQRLFYCANIHFSSFEGLAEMLKESTMTILSIGFKNRP